MSSAASDAARQGYYSEAARLLGDVRRISDRVLRLEVDYLLDTRIVCARTVENSIQTLAAIRV